MTSQTKTPSQATRDDLAAIRAALTRFSASLDLLLARLTQTKVRW